MEKTRESKRNKEIILRIINAIKNNLNLMKYEIDKYINKYIFII